MTQIIGVLNIYSILFKKKKVSRIKLFTFTENQRLFQYLSEKLFSVQEELNTHLFLFLLEKNEKNREIKEMAMA